MNGIDLLLAIIGLLILLAGDRYLAWRDFDRYRRLSRRAHLNLARNLR